VLAKLIKWSRYPPGAALQDECLSQVVPIDDSLAHDEGDCDLSASEVSLHPSLRLLEIWAAGAG
jgi:hypothetical protein